MDKMLQKKIRGMAVRILATIEHTLSCHLDAVEDGDVFKLRGEDLKMLRSEILNSAGDTTRSLQSGLKDPKNANGGVSLSRDQMDLLRNATVGWIEDDSDSDDLPAFQITCSDFNELHKIRDMIGYGVVYNNKYTCMGLEPVLNHLIPLLDKMMSAGIWVADGEYKTWRKEVCQKYLGGLEDE